MKIAIPHIHKIEGDAGFLAEVTKEGRLEALRINTLEGLRQVEGILIGRRIQDVPLVISRICGVCPVVHILNACVALERALDVTVSPQVAALRKLFLASQIIQSHSLHLFFLGLADFFNIDSDSDLIKRFPNEAEWALNVRNYSLKISEILGGRTVHPITPLVGGFSKLPDKADIKNIVKSVSVAMDSARKLTETFKNLSYPALKRETSFISLSPKDEYPCYASDLIRAGKDKMTVSDFYLNKIEEDFKIPPVKRTSYKNRPYMVGAIARVKNSYEFLTPEAKACVESFKKKNELSDEMFYSNIYYNLFLQAVELLHFIEYSRRLVDEILEMPLTENRKEFRINKGIGLSAMEAPRGTLFSYFELDKKGKVLNCNVITPTAQFLSNLEADLRVFFPDILSLSKKKRERKIKSLIRAYDPCISCATH